MRFGKELSLNVEEISTFCDDDFFMDCNRTWIKKQRPNNNGNELEWKRKSLYLIL